MPLATEPKAAQLPLPGGRSDATVRVHPILTGEMHAPRVFSDRPDGVLGAPKIALQALGPRRGWDWLPIPAFLVEHPGAGAILVDTGLHPGCATDLAGNMGRLGKFIYEVRMDHDQALRFQLPARGVQTADVKIVIMTHMHIDHASAVSEFPEATFVLDRQEWDAAAAGGILDGYHPRQFDHAFEWRALNYRADPVESFSGFARALDLFGDGSVRVVSTPGHSAGHQSVVLRTREREILVVADAAFTERALRGDAMPLRIHDEHLYLRSLGEIGRYLEQTPGALAIPGHDPAFWPTLSDLYE
jgi:N-acyl homoserine lactone hydrolase